MKVSKRYEPSDAPVPPESIRAKDNRALAAYYSGIRFNRAKCRMLSFLHPLLQKLSRCIREYPYEIHGAEYLRNVTPPVIYAVSHSEYGPEDIQLVSEILPRPCITLANWNIRAMRAYVRAFFALSGVIYVQRDNKQSRKMAKEKCIEALRAGMDLAIYPESTWNFDEAKLVLPFRHGILKIAAATGASIIPVSLSQLGDRYYVTVGAPLRFSFTDKASEVAETLEIRRSAMILRDALATLKWKALEVYSRGNTTNGFYKRTNLPSDDFQRNVVTHIVDGHYKHGMIIDVAAEKALVYDKD